MPLLKNQVLHAIYDFLCLRKQANVSSRIKHSYVGCHKEPTNPLWLVEAVSLGFEHVLASVPLHLFHLEYLCVDVQWCDDRQV